MSVMDTFARDKLAKYGPMLEELYAEWVKGAPARSSAAEAKAKQDADDASAKAEQEAGAAAKAEQDAGAMKDGPGPPAPAAAANPERMPAQTDVNANLTAGAAPPHAPEPSLL